MADIRADILAKGALIAEIVGWVWLAGVLFLLIWLMVYSSHMPWISPRIIFALSIPPVWLIGWAKRYRIHRDLSPGRETFSPDATPPRKKSIIVQKLADTISAHSLATSNDYRLCRKSSLNMG